MENGFDLFTKIFAGEGSRREMIRRFGGLLGGASLLSAAASCSEPTSPSRVPQVPGGPALSVGSTPGRCRRNNHKCRENSECCSAFCDPATARCTCGPFSELCPQTDICVPACFPGFVFNSQTCKCECAPGFETCGKGGNQGTFCCQVGFTNCCTNPSAFAFDTCCPTTYSCCFGSSFTSCCPPETQCCTSPSGGTNCCPNGTFCCTNRDYGYPYCYPDDSCPF